MATSFGRKLIPDLKKIPAVVANLLRSKNTKPEGHSLAVQYSYRIATANNSISCYCKNTGFASQILLLHRSSSQTASRSSSAFLRPISTEHVQSRNFASDPKDSLGPFKSDGGDNEEKKVLKLMDFNELIWPHPLKTLRNYFFSWLIRGYFDDTFSRESFLNGAEQAVNRVSGLISEGNFDALEGLVTKEAIREIRQNYQNLSLKQRKFIAVSPKDFFFRFIYEIGLIFDDNNNKRFVEITAVLQGLHGLDDARRRNPETYAEEVSKAQDQVYVCNYRFIREFTKGITDDWIINKLNHFSPKEVVRGKSIFSR